MKCLRNISLVGVAIFLGIMSFTSCELPKEYWVFFSVENNDTDSITVYHVTSEDTTKITVKDLFGRGFEKSPIIPPGKKYDELFLGYYEWKKHPERLINNNDFHHIFIFRNETLNKYSTEEICDSNIYDAKYILTTQQIVEMDSVVKYPMEDFSY